MTCSMTTTLAKVKQVPQTTATPGWTFFSEKTSIFTRCDTCGKKVSEFFYKHVREREGGPLVSLIRCGSCLWQSCHTKG